MALAFAALAAFAAADEVRLEELDILSFHKAGWRNRARAKKSAKETPLKVAGTVFANGVGFKAAEGKVYGEYFPGGKAESFECLFGLDDVSAKGAKAVMTVYGDGKLLAASGAAGWGEPVKRVKADLRGVNVVKLAVTESGEHKGATYANMCEAVFTMEDGAKMHEDPAFLSPQLGILTPKPSGEPRINGPELYAARPGKIMAYRVPVSGDKPLEVAVEGLPEGLRFDAATSTVRGTAPKKRGEYPLTIRAKNAKGSAERAFTLVVGDKIGLTPPMGWNSWNCFAPAVSDERVRAQAEAMIRLGLAEHGWQYLVIDDYWERNLEKGKKPGYEHLSGPVRDKDGNIQLNSRFPDMKALTDKIHSLGLKAGIYSSPGPLTCGGCEGSWMHEWQDAKQYADWGFDYLKYDMCTGGTVKFGDEAMATKYLWLMMGKALKDQNRDIYYSLSVGSIELPGYGEQMYANSWRITGDVFNSWPHIRRSMQAEKYCWFYTHPGAWCDPDMLVLQTMGPKRGHRLTPNEQYTHISMWCLFSAPMMIGCDMTRMSEFTLSLLTNDEVLEVNQDRLGLCAANVQRPNGGADEVWAKPMADGSIAAGILNLSYEPRKVKMCFKRLGMRGKWRVRDLWRQKEEGVFENCYEPEVPGHATQLVRIWPAEGGRFDDDVQDVRDFAWMNEIELHRPLKPRHADCGGCEQRRQAAEHASVGDSEAMAEALRGGAKGGGAKAK